MRHFKIEHVEFVREGTHKVFVDLGKEGKIHVIVYPSGPMAVLSKGPVQWLERDLTDAQRKAILKAVSDYAPRPAAPNTYEAKQLARIERMKVRAAKLARESEGALASARARGDRIPMGQPILVGHHSEKRHRSDIAKIQKGYTKGFRLADEAKDLARRADRAEASTIVSSDDPEAVAKLREKLAAIEHDRARMVAANKAVRSPDPAAGLARLGFSPKLTAEILTKDFAGRIGFPAYALSNAASEAGRLKKRIAILEANATKIAPAPHVTPRGRAEETENRVRIFFETKPCKIVIAKLRGAAFKWAPSVGAWQRMASNGAWYAARQILDMPIAPVATVVPPRRILRSQKTWASNKRGQGDMFAPVPKRFKKAPVKRASYYARPVPRAVTGSGWLAKKLGLV